ncbi:dynein light chain Tctex-type protein 2B-like [Gigantopelta aegis]|uniref:dynein light chain Tctex-type protein 2B-like n=1 Tax=Gigantopelta aegis TaxID=1735272 RepID=UPI001B88D342|nr:dynein light chain Tctex-type protein 2B-like [Gigantopelta aegis]
MAERSLISKMVVKSPRRKHMRLSLGAVVHQNSKKASLEGSESHRSKMSNSQLENTYKLQPGTQEKFQTETVRKVMWDTLEIKLHNVRYDAGSCGSLAKQLTDEITCRIKEHRWKRYKLVVQVFVGQNVNQGVQVASRCVWNADTDTYATVSYENSSLFAVASCYAVYYE